MEKLIKIEKNHDFCKKKKILVWFTDPPEDPVISIFAGCLANHDRAHSLHKFGPGFMIWNSQDRTFEVYFGDAGMQAFQSQKGELPP